MTIAERFMNVFAGSEVAHGQTTVGRTKRNGKADAKSFVVREPLTVEKVQAHLDGGQGVGAIPINRENKCRWGAIDVDDYDLDLQDVVRRIVDLGAPLVPCRSKSGGAHIYLFLNRFEEAALVREYLTELASAMGFAGREIFPKQDEILFDRGDVGNFINLPYQNAKATMRYALGTDGNALDVDEFLGAVEKNRCDIADLEAYTLRQKGEEVGLSKDYPPCLRNMLAATGKFNDYRNLTLFHSTVAIKKEFPEEEDWVKAAEEYNARFMGPPMGAKEVATLIDQHKKKDWGFLCDKEPFKSYCDKELCRSCKYGIGGGGSSMPQLSGLSVLMSDPPLYHLNVNGKRIELSLNELNSPRDFQRKCLEKLRIRPPLMKDGEWGDLVNGLLSECTEVDVDPELTHAGQFESLLEEYCTSRIRAMSREEVKMGKPWTEDGWHYFKISGLEDFLRKRDFTHYNRAQMQERIRELSGASEPKECITWLRVRREDGGASTVRVWRVPEFDRTELKLESDDAEETEIPF